MTALWATDMPTERKVVIVIANEDGIVPPLRKEHYREYFDDTSYVYEVDDDFDEFVHLTVTVCKWRIVVATTRERLHFYEVVTKAQERYELVIVDYC